MPAPRSRSTTPALTWLLCTALLALAAGGAGLLRGPQKATPTGDRSLAPAEVGLRVSDAGFDRARPSAEPVQADRAPTLIDPAAPALSLRVVDPGGLPVPGLDLVVFREAPQTESLLRATTDQEGRAWLHPLPEGVVLIQTTRQPPFASTLDAVWMSAGSAQEKTLQLQRGGQVFGRVVDERGLPQAQVPVQLLGQGRGASLRQELTRTDESGRFDLSALAPTPRGVWVVDGQARPERLDPICLAFEWPGGRTTRRFHLDEGEALDLGDVLLPPVRTLVGRVLGPDDRPVPGALVSTVPDFETAPYLWSNQPLPDRAAPSQTFTDPAGRFELTDLSRGWQEVVVIAPDGHFLRTQNRGPEQEHPQQRAPRHRPEGSGQITEGQADSPGEWLLRLPPQCRVRLELSQPDGAPLEWLLDPPWYGMIEVRAHGADGPLSARTSQASALRGGTAWALELPLEASLVHALELVAFGPSLSPLPLPSNRKVLRTLRQSVPQAPPPSTPRRSLLSLRFRLSEPMGLRDRLHVRCCLAPPERQQPGPLAPCCGLGDQGSVTLGAQQVAVRLQPRIEGRYWIALSRTPPADPPEPDLFLGPFATGPQTHEIELDTSAWRRADRTELDAGAAPAPMGSLRLKLLDETGRPLQGRSPRAQCIEPSQRLVNFHADGPIEEGTFRASLPEGTWTMTFAAAGYEPCPPRPVRIDGGQTQELIVSLLRRVPQIFRARLTGAPSPPLPRTEARLLHGVRTRAAAQPALGVFEADWNGPVDSPGPWWWMLSMRPPAHLPARTQAVPYALRFDQPPREAELSRPRFVLVELQLHGMLPQHRSAGFPLLLRQPGLPSIWFNRVKAQPVGDPRSTTQRAHLWIAPGHYSLEGHSTLYHLSERELVVPAGQESVLVEFQLQR